MDADLGRQSKAVVGDRLDRRHVAGKELPPAQVGVETVGVAAEDFRRVVVGIAGEADNDEIGRVDFPEDVGQRLILTETWSRTVGEEHAPNPHLSGQRTRVERLTGLIGEDEVGCPHPWFVELRRDRSGGF